MDIQTYRVIGVMSGTSLDGIDLCEVEFKYNSEWSSKIFQTTTFPYPEKWVELLQNAHQMSNAELLKLDTNYTRFLAGVISDFMKTSNNIGLVCSHGHTVLHQPENRLTYQIGNLPDLAKQINTTVICDFRTADVALGGQGAPLVPVGDQLLFEDYDYCINIGGFVNISFEELGHRIAFDICPANKILNHYAHKLNIPYDDKGEIARSGNYNPKLFDALNSVEFYSKTPPKSLGIEWLEQKVMPILNQYNLPEKDILNTLCRHIAFQISKVIKKENSKLLITGGGAYHEYLMECIKNNLKSTEIVTPSPKLIEYKEALIFGLLGILKYRGEINVLRSVTGAKINHSSGKVFEV